MLYSANFSLRSYAAETSSHEHPFNQWIVPLAGALELQIGNQADHVTLEQGAFIPANETHSFASASDNRFIIIDMKPISSTLFPGKCFWKTPPLLRKFLYFANHFLRADDSLSAQAMVKQMTNKLLTEHFFESSDLKVITAKRWIEEHSYLPINLEILARHCHISAAQLQRRFKKAVGCSLGAYWKTIRLQKSSSLLLEETLSIETIAHQIGYSNLSAFTRSFKQKFGLSPSQYRISKLGKRI